MGDIRSGSAESDGPIGWLVQEHFSQCAPDFPVIVIIQMARIQAPVIMVSLCEAFELGFIGGTDDVGTKCHKGFILARCPCGTRGELKILYSGSLHQAHLLQKVFGRQCIFRGLQFTDQRIQRRKNWCSLIQQNIVGQFVGKDEGLEGLRPPLPSRSPPPPSPSLPRPFAPAPRGLCPRERVAS